MLENILKSRGLSSGRKVAMKSVVSAELTLLAVILPQLVHIALGQSGGAMLLPMYLPMLIGGCLLGIKWGMLVSILSPLASFVLTMAIGTPMPTAERLPFMMAELAVFAIVTGLFSQKIFKNGLWAIPAVVSAQLCGRAVFLGLAFMLKNVSEITPQLAWAQIRTGFAGLAIQVVIVPVIIIVLRKILLRESEND